MEYGFAQGDLKNISNKSKQILITINIRIIQNLSYITVKIKWAIHYRIANENEVDGSTQA